MKISVAQIRPIAGHIEKNIDRHLEMVNIAISHQSDLIVFSELSLTGYEPTLAQHLAIDLNDGRLDEFKRISCQEGIHIALGAPIKNKLPKPYIGMLIFKPGKDVQVYCKHRIHEDEQPYFAEGKDQMVLDVDSFLVGPAICYESLIEDHMDRAVMLGAQLYMASVAKAQPNIEKAFQYYPDMARKRGIPIVMSNCIGPNDDFESVGQSAVWDQEGVLLASLSPDKEGVLTFDTFSQDLLIAE